MTISFLPSQRGDRSQTPLPYTADPWQLLIADIILCFSQWRHVLGILLPMRLNPRTADLYGELYPNFTNIKCLIVHGILIFWEGLFLLSLPLLIFVPVIWMALYFFVFFAIKWFFCFILNGTSLTYEPDPKLVEKFTGHESEYWVYLNGVSVGKDWLKSNLNRLSITFGRKVHGVLNQTDGILFDLIQCLIQRNFTYATSDVRESYVQIKNALYDPKINKVVFIIHSQGGIEGGLIIDWLLAEVPAEYLGQLEVYSFGNAANHFNNPDRGRGDRGIPSQESPTAHKAPTYASMTIGHIEHYANTGDYVAQIGVLHFALQAQIQNRFMGRLFTSPYSGHLLNEHYLHEMFPLDKNGHCLEHNPFMDMPINLVKIGDKDVREEEDESIQFHDDDEDPNLGAKNVMDAATKKNPVAEVAFIGDVDTSVGSIQVAGSSNPNGKDIVHGDPNPKKIWKVRNLSRLWLYRNGGVPPNDPVRRAGTL